MFNTTHPDQIAASNARENYILVDLRSTHEFQNDGIAGSLNIPYKELPDSIKKIPADKEVILVCNNGKVAGAARNFLMGYAKLSNLSALEFGVASLHELLKARKAG